MSELQPWQMSAAQYQASRGIHQPWVCEISPYQYSRMSKRAKAAYDRERRAEWQASIDVKTDWRRLVVASFDAGGIVLDSPDLHPEAAQQIRWTLREREKEAAEAKMRAAAAENAIRSVDEVEVGDRVFDLMMRRYGTITKKFKTSVRLAIEGAPLYGEVREMTVPARELEWKGHDEFVAAVEAGEGVRPR